MKRRLLCILLAVLLILSMPFATFASESGDTGSSGDVSIGDGSGSEDNGGADVGGEGDVPDGGEGDVPDNGENDVPVGGEGDIPDGEEDDVPDDGPEDGNGGDNGEKPDDTQVTVEPVKITGVSGETILSVGDTAKFSVKATGDALSYSWKLKRTGSSYESIGSSSSCSFKIDSDRYDGAEIYCTVSNSVSSADSNVLTITVREDPESINITTHPKSVTVESGKDFTLSAEGKSNKGNVSYSWSYQKNGETGWRSPSESSANTNKLTMTADPSLNGAVFRCKITGATGNDVFVFTNTATVSVSSTIVILEQPASEIEAKEGQPLKLVVTASGENISYYWTYKDVKSTEWILTGVKSNSITIEDVTAAMDGRVYRCKVYSSSGEVYTDEIKISVLPAAPKITSQSDIVQFVTVGDSLSLFVKAEGKDLKYEWEYMLADSNKWVSTKIKRSEFAEEIEDTRYNGAQFRCKVTNESGETLSQVIAVTVAEAPLPPCEDDAHVFTLWNVVSHATENISGLAGRTCEVCGYSEENPIPAGTAPDVDLELLFSGAIVDPDDGDEGTDDGGDIDLAMLAVAAMVLCAAGIIIILVIKKKNSDSGLFDDDEEDDTNEDTDDASSGELSSDTNEFVLPGAEVSLDESSDNGENPAVEDVEQMTKVIPDISEFEDVTELSEENETDVWAEVQECETVTNVIPVSEIEKMLSENEKDPSSEE